MKLFAIYIGGDIAGANIELHDLRFATAEAIEDTYDQLRHEWWGTPASLHLDCWAEVTEADGHAVGLRHEPYKGGKKLYFVNLGGYDGTFGESHRNIFLVADSAVEAKSRAVKMATGWKDPHRDALFEVEKMVCISDLTHQWHVHLTPKIGAEQPPFQCQYRKIGMKLREA